MKTDVGIKLRPFAGEADVHAMFLILNDEFKTDGVPAHESEEEMRVWARRASDSFDARRDITVAEVGGRPVGFAERSWVDTTDGKREYRVNGAVLGEWRRHGIGSALLAENERRVGELSATHDVERPRVLGSWTNDRQTPRTELLRKNGYAEVRWFFEMVRPLSDPIPEVPLPDGIELRPVTMDNVRQIWKADIEAFQDHWGGFDSSEENLQRWIESPSFDPAMWVIAWDGDEVAAGVVNGISPDENAALRVQRGWLHSVFTRRQWRKRGLANALIVRSLRLLADRGMDYGVLGVDAENPSGALGLYERNGFKVAERSTAWRKPL
jgi:ribosomal protein S18 acetylase RimI-like enzyme